MAPFFFNRMGGTTYVGDDAPWSINGMAIETGYLYPHIQKVLLSSVDDEGEKDNDRHNFLVYSLNEGCREDVFLRGTLFQIHKGGRKLNFRFFTDTKELMSPKLIVCPNTEVGVLMLPVELLVDEQGMDMGDVIVFNHQIQKATAKEAPRIHYVGENGEGCIALPDIIERLLSKISGGYRLFNDSRYHLFTYMQTNEQLLPRLSRDDEDDLIRVCRNQNRNYYIADEDRTEMITHLFRNILVASSVEGSGMLMVSKGTDFDENYLTEVVQRRFLWIYVLAFMQRISLIHLHMVLSGNALDGGKEKRSLTALRKESEKLIRMKVNTYFSDVSDFSQHNKFYQFCRTKLGVNRLFMELDDKMRQLDTLLSQKSDKQRETNQKRMTIIIGIMAACSAANDLSDLVAKMLSLDERSPLLIVGSWVIVFVVVVGSYYLWKQIKGNNKS